MDKPDIQAVRTLEATLASMDDPQLLLTFQGILKSHEALYAAQNDVPDAKDALARALYEEKPHVQAWADLSKADRYSWRLEADRLLKSRSPEKIWLNAMSLVRPREDFLRQTGDEIVRKLMQAPRPEPDDYGIRPWRSILLEVTAS